MVNAYLFDLDGTLLDSEVLYMESVRGVLEDFGCPTDEQQALHIAYGHSWDHVYVRFREHCPQWTAPDSAIAEAVAKKFDVLAAERDIRIHGSIDLLRRLARDYPVGIVSGSYRHDIAEGIAYMGIGDCVRLYVGIEDVDAGKPDPAMYRLAAERLGVSPKSCLVFEDSTAGVRSAVAAGMRCVALARPGRPEQDYTGADLVLSDLAEFPVERYRNGP